MVNTLMTTHWQRVLMVIAATAAFILGPAEGNGLATAAPIPQPAEKVTLEVLPSRTSVQPNDQLTIAVVFNHVEGWHIHTNKPKVPESWGDFPVVATAITVSSIKGAQAGPVQWPKAHDIPMDLLGSGQPEMYAVFEGRAVAYVPVIVDAAAAGEVTVELAIEYQACDDTTCVQPESVTRLVTLPVSAEPAAAVNDVATFGAFDPSIFGKMLAGQVSTDATFDFLGYKFDINSRSYWLIMILAFVAGFLLNVTPCVLAVLPLKVLSLQQQANNPVKLVLFGTVYCVGIVATFLVLGLLIFGILTGGQKQDWGQIFSNQWFTVIMAGIIAVMGIGLMGLFTIPLPQSVYALNPSHDSLHGNFLMGVLTAVLSTPCTGPLLGATIAWAATQPPWLGLVTFVVMGVGMASPYAALIAFPKLVDRIPRSGPGGEVLKQVLGVLLLAVAAFLASNLTSDKWTWWVVGGLFVLSCVWAIVQSWRMLRSQTAKRVVTAIAGVSILLGSYATVRMADEGPIPWRKFVNKTDDKVSEAIASELAAGRTVVVDFTAKWCTNCIVIEKTVLNSEAGIRLLNAEDVSPFKVDLSNAEPNQGWGLVKKISGGGGIPLIAVYRPGQEGPTFFNSFFKTSDLAAAIGRPQ